MLVFPMEIQNSHFGLDKPRLTLVAHRFHQLHTFVIHLLPVDLSTGDVHQVELANEHGEEGLQRVGERRECSSFSPQHQVAAHRERHEHDAEDDAETHEISSDAPQRVRELADVFVEPQQPLTRFNKI